MLVHSIIAATITVAAATITVAAATITVAFATITVAAATITAAAATKQQHVLSFGCDAAISIARPLWRHNRCRGHYGRYRCDNSDRSRHRRGSHESSEHSCVQPYVR
jgi:hypothetical protein